MVWRLTVVAGALINGILWTLLSLLLVPVSWAIVLGLLAFVGALPVMAAIASVRGDIAVATQSGEVEPIVAATLHHHTGSGHEKPDVSVT